MKKNKDVKKEDLKGAIKFLKQFMTLSYKQQVNLIKKLEKRLK